MSWDEQDGIARDQIQAPTTIIAVVTELNDEADRACKGRTGRGYASRRGRSTFVVVVVIQDQPSASA